MQQTFVKTIHSHEIEFVRLLYPLRYQIIIRRPDQNPIVLMYETNDEHTWGLTGDKSEVRDWGEETTAEIHRMVMDNEEGCKVH